MKKKILSAIAFSVLLSGCNQVNEPTPTTEIKKEQKVVADVLPDNAIDMKSEILSFYNEWKGTKYRSGGTTKKGIDSAALTQKLYKEKFFTDLPRKAKEQLKIGTKVKKTDLTTGDVVFFKRKGILYTGVMVEGNQFLHTSFKGVKLENLDKSPYKYRYYTARRVF